MFCSLINVGSAALAFVLKGPLNQNKMCMIYRQKPITRGDPHKNHYSITQIIRELLRFGYYYKYVGPFANIASLKYITPTYNDQRGINFSYNPL